MNRKGLHLDQAPPLSLPLRFFLTAPLFAIAAGILLAWQGAEALRSPWAFQTVALTHLITLGFLTMVMAGALYQIVPVVVGSMVPRVGLAPLVHGGLCVGLLGIAGGMLGNFHPLLWLSLAALLPAFLIFVGQLAVALIRAPSPNVTVFSIALAIASLAVAVSLGTLFLGEYAFGWLAVDRRALTAIHVYLALGGWISPMITGVGYVVIPMFYLSGPFPKGQAWMVLGCQVTALVSGILAALLASSPLWHLLPMVTALAGFLVFTFTALRMLRGRRRRTHDTTLRFWQVGLAAAPLSLAVLAIFTVRQEPRWLLAFGALFLLGFGASVINGMLYKIVAFLVWLHRFSKLAGKVHVPMLRDIIPPRQTVWQWWSYQVMLALVTASALTGHDGLARLAGLSLIVTFGGLFLILLRAARFNPDPARMKSLAPGNES